MGKRLLPWLLCLLLLASLFTGCAPKSTVVRVNEVTHSIFYAPFYVAINQGFFKEQGLEIELTNGGGSDKSMTAVLSGQADIGLMGPETAVYVYNEGKENFAVIVGQLTKRDGSFLLGKTPDPLFTWEKVRGTSIIGGRKGGMPEMTLEYVLKANGMVPNEDVTVRTDVQFNLMGGAFIAGNDDYVALFEPSASTMELAEEGYIVASVGQSSGEVPYTAFMCIMAFLQEHPDTVEKFIAAVYKGQQWVESHTAEEIANAIAPSFADSDKTLLKTVVARYKSIDVWKTDPILLQKDFEKLLAVMDSAGVLEKTPDYAAIVDNSVAQQILNKG